MALLIRTRGRVLFFVLLVTGVALAFLAAGVLGSSAAAEPTSTIAPTSATTAPRSTQGWTQVVKGGFTDPNNSYAPTWATFKDHLYISTSANESGSVFSGSDKAGGDIWRTADGVDWEQIGTAGLGNPHNNFFQLIVFRDKLYAISNNINDHGIEIWVTSDGTEFVKIENGGFGDKNNDWAFPYVFQDRLILGCSNSGTGAEIWVSDDGQSFRQVVDGGLGDSGVTGFTGFADPEHPDPIFQGQLYIGVSNPDSGGEIWRTADGLEWERVAEKGLTRSNTILLHPDIVYQDELYAFGTAGGTLDNLPGFDLFRTADGTTWEQVVEDGFSVGKERNIHGDLEEFKGKLYLTSNTMDPRVLMPTAPYDRLAPRGFQMRVSDDGKTWKQVGEDGFGLESSIMAGTEIIGDTLYLTVFDYHEGSRLLRSTDGEKWETIFQETDPNFFQEGGGALPFKGHFLWLSNDLKNGFAIWRSDEVMVAEETTTSSGASTTAGADTSTSVVTSGSTDSDDGSGGGDVGGSSGGHEAAGGLSGGWIALIAVLGVFLVASIAAVVFLAVWISRRPGGTPPAPPVTLETPDSPAFRYCSSCGTAVNEGAGFCPGCGRPVSR
jgi:hypothetical protein